MKIPNSCTFGRIRPRILARPCITAPSSDRHRSDRRVPSQPFSPIMDPPTSVRTYAGRNWGSQVCKHDKRNKRVKHSNLRVYRSYGTSKYIGHTIVIEVASEHVRSDQSGRSIPRYEAFSNFFELFLVNNPLLLGQTAFSRLSRSFFTALIVSAQQRSTATMSSPR